MWVPFLTPWPRIPRSRVLASFGPDAVLVVVSPSPDASPFQGAVGTILSTGADGDRIVDCRKSRPFHGPIDYSVNLSTYHASHELVAGVVRDSRALTLRALALVSVISVAEACLIMPCPQEFDKWQKFPRTGNKPATFDGTPFRLHRLISTGTSRSGFPAAAGQKAYLTASRHGCCRAFICHPTNKENRMAHAASSREKIRPGITSGSPSPT
jgi:hypothetical protein